MAVPAATLVLLGSSLPVLQDSKENPIVGVTRYGFGRLAVFGGERMLSDCCRPATTADRGGSPSQDFDDLVYSVVRWAAGAPHEASGRPFQVPSGKARIRVSLERLLPLARYMMDRAPDAFVRPAQRAGGGRGVVLSLGKFLAGGPRGAVDVYVIGAYDSLYQLPYVQRMFFEHVASGGALVVAGPDVTPSVFYATEALSAGGRRRTLAASEMEATAGHAWLGAWRDAAAGQRRHSGCSGVSVGVAGFSRGYSVSGGEGSSRRLLAKARKPPPAPAGSNSANNATGKGGPPVFNGTSVDVGTVTGPMGILFGNVIIDAGTNATLAGAGASGNTTSLNVTVLLSNALIAVQQLVDYKRGRLVLDATQLKIADGTVFRAQAALSRSSPGSQGFWLLADTYASLQPKPPPSPPPPSPLPPARPPARPPPSPAATVFCLVESLLSSVAHNVTLPPPVSRAACAANITAAISSGVIKAPPASIFVGLKQRACMALLVGRMPPAASQASLEECSTPCPGTAGQRCGNARTGLVTAYPYLG